MERKIGPFIAFQEEIEADVEKRNRLNLYYREKGWGIFYIYLSKKPRMLLARAVPQNLVSINTLQKDQEALFLNEPVIPIQSPNPTPEDMALTLFSVFIPQYISYAEGKTLDLYSFERRGNMRSLPDIRVKITNDLVTISHPSQESLAKQKVA